MEERIVLETDRLRLRWLTPEDAPFILELYTDPDFLRQIGDRGIHDKASAERYLESDPMTGYARDGFHLNAVVAKEEAHPVGVCGILKRKFLEMPDLGFAMLPAYRRRGYTREAAKAVLRAADTEWRLPRVGAIVSPGNAASLALLQGLGFIDRGLRRPFPASEDDVRWLTRESADSP